MGIGKGFTLRNTVVNKKYCKCHEFSNPKNHESLTQSKLLGAESELELCVFESLQKDKK